MHCKRFAWGGLMRVGGGAFAGELDWLAGHGCGADSEEVWQDESSGRAFGMNRSRNGSPPAFEFMRIERVADGWNFIVQPGGSPPTVLTESARGEFRLEFSHRSHDFPQRVRYRRDRQALHARIDDGRDQKAIDCRWNRCADSVLASRAAADEAAPGG